MSSTMPAFGAGGDRPYDVALRNGAGKLRLVDASGSDIANVRVARFLADANSDDRTVLVRTHGSVLDVGCGPGRMLQAAIGAGHLCLGIDVSAEAIAQAHARGLPAIRRSVFGAIPREGSWDTILLLDGNIGIGGDPAMLLTRCAHLLSPHGTVVVELHPDTARERSFVARVIDADERVSHAFPWAELGAIPLEGAAAAAGFDVTETWWAHDRAFAQLTRR